MFPSGCWVVRLTAISCPSASNQRSFRVLVVPHESCSCYDCHDCQDYSKRRADCEASHHFEKKKMANENDSTGSSPVSGKQVSPLFRDVASLWNLDVDSSGYAVSYQPSRPWNVHLDDPVVAFPQQCCHYPSFGPTKDALSLCQVSTCPTTVSLADLGRASPHALSALHSVLPFPHSPPLDATGVFASSLAASSQEHSPDPEKLDMSGRLLLGVG